MLKSNLKAVIARMEELQAGIPGCIERALDAGYWLPALRASAEKTLQAQLAMLTDVSTRTRYQALLPRILDTLMVKASPGTKTFEMWLPAETLTDVSLAGAAKYASWNWTPHGRAKKGALLDPDAEPNLQASRQAILDWVQYEKQWDERDKGRTPEEVAERIETILGLRPAFHERNQKMEEAATGLREAIEAWLEGADTTPSGGHAVQSPATDPTRGLPTRPAGLTNALARQWLEAVLQSWWIYFRVHVRDRIEDEFKKLHRKVKGRQPGLGL